MKNKLISLILLSALVLTSIVSCKQNNLPTKSEDSSVASIGSSLDVSSETEFEDESSLPSDSTAISDTTSVNSSSASESTVITSTITTSVDTSVKTDDIYKDLKGTTVRVISFAEPDTLGKIMIKEFEKKYGCSVKMEIYGWEEWQTKILEMVAAGTPPDLAICFDQQFLKYVTSGILQPIDGFIDPTAEFWDPNILNNYKWKGKTYCVNTKSLDGIMMNYNKNLLENAGLDGSADPMELYKRGEWTFDKFREYAKLLTTQKDGVTDVWGYASWVDDAFIWAAGGREIDVKSDGSITITLDKPAEIAGIEMLRAMIHDDKSTSFAAQQNFTPLFRAQKVAFHAERPGYAIENLSAKLSFEVGMVPFPKLNKAAKHYTPAITQGWGVPVGAKNPKAAMAYIYYSAVFSEANKNTTFALTSRRKTISDAQLVIYNDAIKSNPKTFSFVNGAGNWYNKRYEFLWLHIWNDNQTAVNAVATAKPALQYEIDQVLKAK